MTTTIRLPISLAWVTARNMVGPVVSSLVMPNRPVNKAFTRQRAQPDANEGQNDGDSAGQDDVHLPLIRHLAGQNTDQYNQDDAHRDGRVDQQPKADCVPMPP